MDANNNANNNAIATLQDFDTWKKTARKEATKKAETFIYSESKNAVMNRNAYRKILDARAVVKEYKTVQSENVQNWQKQAKACTVAETEGTPAMVELS